MAQQSLAVGNERKDSTCCELVSRLAGPNQKVHFSVSEITAGLIPCNPVPLKHLGVMSHTHVEGGLLQMVWDRDLEVKTGDKLQV